VAGKATQVDVGGRQLSITNLDKVLYPETGFTKGEVINYYVRIAPAMIPHLEDRCVTFKRFPNGVDDKFFFEKRCPSHRPDWVKTAVGPGDRDGGIDYCVLDDVPSLAWAGNLAALELHTPMSRSADMDAPTMVVFDLDPGAPAGMQQCADVGLDIRDSLAGLGLEVFAKTSGSKGLQVYLPLNTPHTTEQARGFSLAVAQLLEKHHPTKVVSSQNKELRRNKVLIDWSQNAHFKTTICAYSLRARPHPTVSTPVTWDEVEAAAGGAPLSFEAADVLARVEEHGDLFAPTATLRQTLPALS
jgi:bifunctional non-homologous end joining protein LigD